MEAAIVIDTREIQQISQAKEIRPRSLMVLAKKINTAAVKIEKQWHKISIADREKLENLADKLTEPSRGMRSWFLNFLHSIRAIFIVATGQADALIAYDRAVDLLINNIFDAVEREDPEYQAVLSDTLQELISEPNSGKVLKKEETRGWLRSLSYRAIRKI